ncbi:MAG: rhodanese-like domain-containing protein [Candidatus Thiodiazotropha sp.]|nr:sulfurtransferase [Candidatus Thiodiazotropha taylori]MBT3058872.1 sulfurtransferase [Candidatus Thiodiazotropha sp. (ex Lucina pensylvanica)]MBT3063088.1 sulfurtransferase [Candidatus Thiodiazotropha sp. (ex Lucina pensylvanica)]MBV2096237.1 sulfurtransferase [Candidatus Thiodiazotropha sp. (ex Codakia orbicularis)]PUB75803.1 MAG: sulfurtransferase [gamma proteobacterium symbiont of Ctena orbiculata]
MKRSLILLLLMFPGMLAAAVEPLVTPSWLHNNRDNPDLVLLDLQDNQNYLRFHIPGSINTNYAQWRVEKKGQLKNMPPVPLLEKLIGSLGIDNNSHVVLISLGASAGDMAVAARVYWTFKVLGHDRVSILDGGLVGYAEKRVYPLEKGNHQLKPKTFRANYRKQMNPGADEVRSAIGNGTRIVDNRTRAEYLGIYGGGGKERAGRLPQAVHLNYDWLTINGGGKLHSPENLQRIYASSKVPLQGDQINYCHTGNRAALGWFVSHEILGNRQAKLYDGSTQEWAASPALPMEQQVKLSY